MQRLKTRAQFQAVMASQTVSRTPHFVLHRLALAAAPAGLFPSSADAAAPASWVGAVAPKRWARRAVTRNAIKRQIYTLAPQCAGPWAGSAQVVRLRAAFDRAQYPSATSSMLKQAVRAELEQLFAQARP